MAALDDEDFDTTSVEDGGADQYDQVAEAPAPPTLPATVAPSRGSPIAPPSGGGAGPSGNRYVDAYRRGRAGAATKTPDYGEIIADAPAISAPSPRGPEQGLLKDLGDTFWHGALSMGSDLAGIAKYGADVLNVPAVKSIAESSRAWAEDHMAKTIAGMSTAGQKAMQASIGNILSDDPNAPKPGDAGWFRYLATNTVGMLPSLVFALVPGGVIGRAATGVAKAAALASSREAGVVLSSAAARAAGKEAIKEGAYSGAINTANVLAQGVGWGAAGGGRAYNALVKEIGDASEQEMLQNPAYRTLREANKTDLEAKTEIIKQLAPAMVGMGAGANAAAGAVGGQLLRSGTGQALGTSLTRRVALGAAEGAGAGGIQAAGDVGAEQYGATGAGKAVDPNAIFKAGALGAIGGGVLGAGAGAMHGRAKPKAPVNPDVPPEVGAAMGEGSPIKGPQGYDAYGPEPEHMGGHFPPGEEQGRLVLPQVEGAPTSEGQGDLFQPPPTSPPVAQLSPRAAEGVPGLPPGSVASPITPPHANYPEMPRAPSTLGDPHLDAATGLAPNVDTMGDPSMDAALQLPGPARSPIGAAPENAPRPAETLAPQPQAQSQVEPIAQQQASLPLTEPQTAPRPGEAPPENVPGATVAPAAEQGVPPPTMPASSLPKVARGEAVKAKSTGKRTAGQIQREDGVGFNEATRRAKAEAAIAEPTAPAEAPGAAAAKDKSKPGAKPEPQADELRTLGYDRNPDDALQGRIDHINERLKDPNLPAGTRKELTARAQDFKRFIERRDAVVHTDPELQTAVRRMRADDTITGKNTEGEVVTGRVSGFGRKEVGVVDSDGIHHDVHVADISNVEHTGRDTTGPGESTPLEPGAGDTPVRTSDPALGKELPPETMHTPAEAAPTKPVEEAEPDLRTHHEMVRETLETAADATVEPLSKKNKDAVLKRLMGEIDDIMHLNTTPASLGRALRSWAEDHTDPIPGTKTWRSEIYDEVKDRLAGKKDFATEARETQVRDASAAASARRAPGGPAEGAREDVETHTPASEGGGFGSREEALSEIEAAATGEKPRASRAKDEGAPAPDEHAATVAEDTPAGEESSAGLVTDYGEGKTDLVSKSLRQTGRNLLKQALNGEKPLHQIVEQFGDHSDQPNATFKNFEDYVQKELERVTHPKFAEEAIQKYNDAHDKNYIKPNLDPKKPGAKLTAKERQGMAREATNMFAQSDPDRVGKLEDLLRELRDPVGLAADRESWESHQSRLAGPGTRPSGIAPASSRSVQAIHEHPVNSFIQRRISEDRPYTLHEALRDIISNATGEHTGPMRELAKQFLKMAPDIEVVSSHRARERGWITKTEHAREWSRGKVGGEFQTDYADPQIRGRIILNPDRVSQHATTLLHEASHAITSRHIENLHRNAPGHQDMRALTNIAVELVRHLNDPNMNMSDRTRRALLYALQDPHELHTVLMTQPEAHAFANRVRASDHFLSEQAKIGYNLQKGVTPWKAFTNWVRKIMGRRGPASASEATFFDHIMSPLQTIARHGAEYNERKIAATVAKQPHLEPGIRLASRLGDMLEGGARAVGRNEYANAFREHGMKMINGLTPDDILHDRYKGLFNTKDGNGLTRMQTSKEATENFARAFYDKYDPITSAWNNDWKSQAHPDREALGSLMNDTTIANVALNGGDNSHLKTPEEQAKASALQARFNALPQASKDLYKRAVEVYKNMDQEMRDAHLQGILHDAFPEANDAQRALFAKTVHSRKSTEAFLKDPANSDLAQALGDTGSVKLARAVVRLMDVGRIRGDYFPLKRDGDYIVRYGEGENYGSERYKTQTEANERVAQLKGEGTQNVHAVDIKDPVALRQEIGDHPAMRELVSELSDHKDLRGHADKIEELAHRIILRNATQSELARAKRRGIQGAMTDHGQVMAKDVMENRRTIGIARHGGERWAALNEMKRTRDAMRAAGDERSIVASRVIQEHEKRLAASTDPSGVESTLARRATAAGFVQNLMSLSHMAINTMQAQAMATSLLGGRHGAGAAALSFNKALAQGAPTLLRSGFANSMKALRGELHNGDWKLANVVRDRYIKNGALAKHMNALFEAIDKANLIDYSESAQLRDMARGGASRVGGLWNRFTGVFSAGNHAMDVANKAATAKAAFDLEFRKTSDVAKSTAYAVDMVRKVMPNYNPYNKARLTQGMLAPVMQFKNYGLHMYGTMGNLVREVYKNEAGGRAEAMKTLGLIVATHSLLAGGLTTISDPLRLFYGAQDLWEGRNKPHNWRADWQNGLADILGPELGEAAAHGLPSLIGMSQYRRTGLSDMLSIPELEEYSSKGVMRALGQAAFGASGESAGNAFEGVTHLIKAAGNLDTHELGAGMKQLAPRPIRDVLKAVELGTTGLEDKVGKQTMRASTSPWDIAQQAIGIQPSSVERYQSGRYAITSAMQEAAGERGDLAHRWLRADPTDRPAIWREITDWNRAHPATRITVTQLLQQMHAAQKDLATPGTLGVRVPAKQVAAMTNQARFANF